MEHCVGINGDSFRDVVEKWNTESMSARLAENKSPQNI